MTHRIHLGTLLALIALGASGFAVWRVFIAPATAPKPSSAPGASDRPSSHAAPRGGNVGDSSAPLPDVTQWAAVKAGTQTVADATLEAKISSQVFPAEHPTTEQVGLVVEGFVSTDLSVRRWSSLTAAHLIDKAVLAESDRQTLEALLKSALEDQEWRMRRAAIAHLTGTRMMRDSAWIEKIRSLQNDPQPEVASRARQALADAQAHPK